ncbi:hypothetical protein V2J09_000409 [Rumex salicifolius]
MEISEVEAVLEKIWDLHDKLSDAIHSISRNHFLSSLKNPSSDARRKPAAADDDNCKGFVYFKDWEKDSAVSEAKSLNAIRTALENLEYQLEFFHTVQIQQRAERDVAYARLEQTRMILSLRLAEHHGKRYKVIEEALDFIKDVQQGSCFVSPENLSVQQRRRDAKSNLFIRLVSSGIGCAKRFEAVTCKSSCAPETNPNRGRKASQHEHTSSDGGDWSCLDVHSGRG